jgi:hypothetical protein
LRFDGDTAPYDYKPHLQWWGLSVLEGVWECFKRYETGNVSASSLLQDFDLYVHSLSGLADMIAKGQENHIRARMQALAMGRSVTGGIVIDKDREQVDFLTRSVAGVSDIVDRLKEDVQGASRLPHTKLWGSSPSGLGADGRSEDSGFAQETNQWQQDHLDRPLRQFYKVLAACSDGNAKTELPDDWKIHFHSTFVLSDAEKAELRSKVAAADSQYIQSQVLQPHEVAVARYGGAEWTMEVNLIDRAPDGAIKQPEEPASPPVFGGDLAPLDQPGAGNVDGPPAGQPEDATGQAAAADEGGGNGEALQGPSPAEEEIPRTDGASQGRADGCCKPCDAAEADGLPKPCEAAQADTAEEELTDGQHPASVAATMHRWKRGNLHSGTGQPGEHREVVAYDPEHHQQAIAIALALAGQARPRSGRGRRRGVKADGSRATGRQLVAGVPVVVRADGSAHLVGAHGEALPLAAAIGFDSAGIWEVLDGATQQWCAVVGVEHESAVRAAAGPGARVRRMDSIDMVAMGVRCDAYDA